MPNDADGLTVADVALPSGLRTTTKATLDGQRIVMTDQFDAVAAQASGRFLTCESLVEVRR